LKLKKNFVCVGRKKGPAEDQERAVEKEEKEGKEENGEKEEG